MLTDQELILQLRQRQEAAFRLLVETYGGRVYNTVLNILQNPTDAEDAAQEVFISIYQSIDSFREDARLSTWIYRIAVRKAIDKQRRAKTRQRLQAILPWWMPSEGKADKAVFNHPGVVLDNKEQAAMLFKAINGLPEKQKIAFTLVKVQGLPYEEAAGIMQQGIKAIESLVMRAKQNLQQQLQTLKNG